MMVLGASYFTGDKPKSTSSGMSSSAPPPVARMGTMKRSRLARAANGGSHLEDGQRWIMVALWLYVVRMGIIMGI